MPDDRTDKKLSENFWESEFRCHCCGRLVISDKLIVAAQSLRNRVGSSIIVTSGYRCPTKNAETPGAVKNSPHLQGIAFDCVAPKKRLLDFLEDALHIEAFSHGGIGLYPVWTDGKGNEHDGFLHLDVGPERMWGRVRKRYVGYVEALNFEYKNGSYMDRAIECFMKDFIK